MEDLTMLIRILFTIAYAVALLSLPYLLPNEAYIRLHPLAPWVVVGVYAVVLLHFALLWWHPLMGTFGLLQPRRGESR
jgi:hypothetical protein